MWILHGFRGAFVCFLVSLVLSSSFCYGDGQSIVEVVGSGECADCANASIMSSHAFSGLRVSIDCKAENGEMKTRGVGELDQEGKFKVKLPNEMVKDGKLREECYAQLHSASATPCPTHRSSKIILKSHNNGQNYSFGLPGKLRFSPVTCTSQFLWPHFRYPPLPKLPPFLPKWKLPPFKSFGHPYLFPPFPPKVFPKPPPKAFPPLIPVYKPPPKVFPPPVPLNNPPPVPVIPLPPPVPIKKPCPPKKYFPPKPPVFKPPPVPIYKPRPKVKPPVIKPLPPPVPMYKPKPEPKPPVIKPLPPPVPIYKPKPKTKPPVIKPLPPPIPIYKPKPPLVLPPPVPIYKPLPPIPKIHPFYKKPCPPLPKLPPIPKIPPKYFHHPKFGKWTPLPPFSTVH